MHKTDRTITEDLLPVLFFRTIIVHGYSDAKKEEAQDLLETLNQAECEVLVSCDENRKRKLMKRATRIHNGIVDPFKKQEIAVAKFGLIIYYALHRLVGAGRMIIEDNSPMDQFTTALLAEDGSLSEMANVSKIDASAQKQSKKVLLELQAEGLFRDFVWE